LLATSATEPGGGGGTALVAAVAGRGFPGGYRCNFQASILSISA